MDSSTHDPISGSTTTVGVAVVAGGSSRRMQGLDKLFVSILGRPLLLYCMEAFQCCPLVDRIVIATAPASVARVRSLASEYGMSKVVAVVTGGNRRQDSVANALDALGQVEIVLVHDGARPFVDDAMVRRAVDAGKECGAATAAVPVKDTIKIASADMTVSSTPPRDTLWAAQTPQSFDVHLLREAHRTISDNVTDDAAMVEMLGRPVRLFLGSHDNIKVTTPEDIAVADAIARARFETSPP